MRNNELSNSAQYSIIQIYTNALATGEKLIIFPTADRSNYGGSTVADDWDSARESTHRYYFGCMSVMQFLDGR